MHHHSLQRRRELSRRQRACMVLAHNCTEDQAEQCARLLLLAGRYQEERLRLFDKGSLSRGVQRIISFDQISDDCVNWHRFRFLRRDLEQITARLVVLNGGRSELTGRWGSKVNMLEALLMSLHQLAHPTTLYEVGAIFGLRPERISEATNAFLCFIHSETNEVGKLRDLKLWAHRFAQTAGAYRAAGCAVPGKDFTQ